MQNLSRFVGRHIGPQDQEIAAMLKEINSPSLEALTQKAIPEKIKFKSHLDLPKALEEHEALEELADIAKQNIVARNMMGQGYYGTIVPPVIQRNILENPGWYTQYTPYQAEIAQGRMEALLNFQTMISDLTALPIANASLLDEATAAAEAMAMAFNISGSEDKNVFWVERSCFEQTKSVIGTRAEPLGIKVVFGSLSEFIQNPPEQCFSALLQYPSKYGDVANVGDFFSQCASKKIISIAACDLLSLCLLKAPGELGADIAVGSAQRFGVPLGFGGPHAAFLSTKDEYKRKIPGRIIGLSKDRLGKPALRLAMQTREQHIRRDKATSNICTAQVLLAVMASMYAVYHGPEGLKAIATRIHQWTNLLGHSFEKNKDYKIYSKSYFDTLCIIVPDSKIKLIRERADQKKINFSFLENNHVLIAVDEAFSEKDYRDVCEVFDLTFDLSIDSSSQIHANMKRSSTYLTHRVFNSHLTESKMLRYIRSLESKDLSLTKSMIPLGSCTMKLNATSELFPVSWPSFSNIHPYAPSNQVQGYLRMLGQLESFLSQITGFEGISLQPNAGSQGEYAGLLVIRAYHRSRGELNRNICLIPKSAHGTNPASAVMAGMKVQVVECDQQGNVDLQDLKTKIDSHRQNLAALMITYPSTHGVFEESIREICDLIHEAGGQVYMDGANMNAQVGLCRPGDFGPDVCHLNLHKTFCIPHGGGGPGMGPIGVKEHLKKFLPTHPFAEVKTKDNIGPVSAAAWGSASILPISWMYIRMMGAEGLKKATQVAILNANYIAKRLENYFPILYKASNGLVAHECIIDLQAFKSKVGIDVDDIAKRLMDYGFHAPTVSFPVPNTMMIEPTESESMDEIDRFCDAMIAIHGEISKVAKGEWSKEDNPLKNAPHTAEELCSDSWQHSYSRDIAAFPSNDVRNWKFWPSVSRVDNAFGDRNLVCTCPSIESYS